jgi:acyl transferase domain-containing protein/NADPH:quinone reductase-like Zn-dependent oxidoreductase/NAD(P)-dependent dehydrogenase (short-subunit alcohol dehydrogenase family)/acyl carrier protein
MEYQQTKVAIVGVAWRLPGQEQGPLWSSLVAGRDLVTRVPEDRWSQDAYGHPSKSAPGSAYSAAAGTLGKIDGFDAAFFGISPREAEQLDPQQRLLLEMAWEAFESAGIPPSSVKGERGGVFIGFSGSDWSYRRADDLASLDATSMTGQTGSVAANRISYQFDLRGPSIAVDTACSSSLVAFHQACQSISSGESTLALAGGISLHLHPYAYVGFSRASMLSPRGICNVFDAAGDGYVRSEGGGLFLLKPLSQALKDGDRILAVVAGSGMNCDGRTNGITVPGADAQAELLSDVYRRAGIDPSELDYVEAHGTGTAVGDPIECRALGMALGQRRATDRPLLIGSVKSNLGHLETASGVAGLAKALLCLRHRAVPPTIHLKTPNPNIRFDDWNLRVVTEPTPLDPARKLTIGINSFGFGGANAHVVLQSSDDLQHVAQPAATRPDMTPLIVSGRSEAAAHAAAAALAVHLDEQPQDSLYDVTYSAAFHREWHTHRVVAFANDRNALATALKAHAAGQTSDQLVSGETLANASPPVFVYSGNGSQWAGMARDLLQQSDTFCRAIRAVDALFLEAGAFSIEEALRLPDDEQRLERTEVAQPLLFAIQVGLTEMLREWGVAPAAVVGHSVGEVAAAWACGSLNLAQAVQVIHGRSAQQGRTKGTGGMTAIGLGESAGRALLAELGLRDSLAMAGINSDRGITLAGRVADLVRLEQVLTEREVFHRRLDLDYAFHSPAMEAIREPLQQCLAALDPQRGEMPFYSTVTGGRLAGDRLDADYWWRNIREPVQFQASLEALIGDGFNVFVEIGPHAVLRTYINDCLRSSASQGRVITCLQRGDSSADRVRATCCGLLVAGSPLDLHPLFPVRGRFVDLPHYPWQRERYWHPLTSEGYNLINRYPQHPLLGYRLHENAGQWENHLDTVRFPNLADHAVGNTVVFPAAGFVEMALAAARLWHGNDAQEIEDLEIVAPLLLEAQPAKTVRLAIEPGDGRFTISSRERLDSKPWLPHVVGRLPGRPEGGIGPEALEIPLGPPAAGSTEHYALTTRVGLNYGPSFRAVDAIWKADDRVLARLVAPAAITAELAGYQLHPAFLDAAFQLLVDILGSEIGSHGAAAFVPVKVGRLRLLRPAQTVRYAAARLLRRSPRSVVASFILYDEAGQAVAELSEVRFRGVLLRHGLGDSTGYLHFEAVPKPHPQALPPALKSSGSLPDACRAILHAPERMEARQLYQEEVEPLLDVLCAAFAKQALKQLSGGHAGLNLAQLLGSGTVATPFGPYLQRLLDILLEDGVLEPDGDALAWVATASEQPDAADIWRSLLADYPDYAAEILLLGRVGHNLAAVLSGEIEPSALLPDDPTHPLLSHYLSGSPSVQAYGLAISGLVTAAQANLAPGTRLRVLEYSSCRSQLAAQLLPHLDVDRCDYRIAAMAQSACQTMETLCERFPALDIRLLDLRHPPEDDERFDIVLLNQELATAADPPALLAALVARLVPGGLLVVAEQPPARWSDLVFGLQPDWWLKTGHGRSLPRLQPARAWQDLMARQGFAEVQLVHELPGRTQGPYLLLARKSQADANPTAISPAEERSWLLVSDPDGEGAVLAELLATRLRAARQRVFSASAGPGYRRCGAEACELRVDSSSDLQRLFDHLRDLHGKPAGIVLLHGLLAPAGQDVGERCVVAAELAKACAAANIAPDLLLVSCGATADLLPAERTANIDDATLWGFGRTLMNEYPEQRIRLLELADPHDPEHLAETIAIELLAPDAEDEVIYGVQGRYVPRLRTVELAGLVDTASEPRQGRWINRLDFTTPGPLKHLHWRPQLLAAATEGQVEITVKAAGLNFRDVMYAMGLLSDEAVEHGFAGPTLGMELAGVVSAVGPEVGELAVGDEVIAFAPACFAERVVTASAAVARKPAGWSFNAAATVPTTFFTAYYALQHLARLQPGERLLIHGAAGGVGLAAIQLGKALGAEIFATAGSAAKRDIVRLVGANHVLDSRSLAFADDVLALTGGEGVDVVLNSLAGEAINRNLRILRPFGRFLELGKRDFYENTRIGLRPFRNNITYFGIDADQLMAERPALTKQLFGELMQLFEQGELSPLPFRAFPATQAVEAFRYMQQSRQIGKVVLNFDGGVGPAQRLAPPPLSLQLDADGTYLVTGGTRGFGLATACWLARKGARHLMLLSRRGTADPEGATSIADLQAKGVQVRTVACDVSDRIALDAALQKLRAELPPLRGIVHAAMVIDDGLVRNLDAERIRKVLAPKVLGARHLDALTRDDPLDFLVFYSSATTLFGNPGQASYVAANRYLEVLAAQRRSAGLPALAVSWGAIDDVGYLSRHTDIKAALQSRMGGAALNSREALDALEQLLMRDLSGLGVMDLDWAALRRFLPGALSPKFQELGRQAEEAGADAEGQEQLQRWLEDLDDEELSAALAGLLKQEIGEILHIAPERIADDRSLYDLGMDSLMGVELAAAVEVRFGVNLPIMALSEGPTVGKLVERIVRQLRTPQVDQPETDEILDTAQRLAAQHGSEVNADTMAGMASAVRNSRGDGRLLREDE